MGAELRKSFDKGIGPLTSLPRYLSLYQINTRVWLTELSRSLGRRATLDDIPDGKSHAAIRSTAGNFTRPCPTCGTRTSPVVRS